MKLSYVGLPYSITKRRILTISVAFFLFLCILFINLFRISYIQYEYYQRKAFEEVTTTSKVRGNRGIIYDRNMNVLATNVTSYRIFLSTREVRSAKKKRPDIDKIIAEGFAEILNLDSNELLTKINNKKTLDVTIIKNATEEQMQKILSFAKENDISDLIGIEGTSKRYYPYDTVASHVLGFCGSDGQGLYGLEYEYETILAGNLGSYLYAKDAKGNALPSGFETYIEPTDGYNIVTTIDLHVQQALETQLETIRVNHNVNNRVTGIVMDTKTGAILGMATSSPFNPNDPYTLDSGSQTKLDSQGLTEGSIEYKSAKKDLLEIMWSNKAVSETYEPGSTFKIVTVSTALDLGVAKTTDTFSCHGYYEVGGWRIRCHKTTGHGSGFTLAYGLQMSCNPTMMQIAERIGAIKFYEYVKKFGYFEKTGIDLPSEGGTIFHELSNLGSVELATSSFGQRFKVTVISQLVAVAAVANGGMKVTPHLLEKVTDKDGNIVREYESPERASVISKEVATLVSSILEEGVSGSGGAKNAYVDGYKVAAKTGTSQKFDVLDSNGNSYLRIGSTVAYAPSDDSGIAVIIVVDEPMSSVKYGSYVAAPYVSTLLSDILPYLGYESSSKRESFSMPNLVGLSVKEATEKLKNIEMNYSVIGENETILYQIPTAGQTVTSTITSAILYTEKTDSESVLVPKLVGLSPVDANKKCTDAGLTVSIKGVGTSSLKSEDVKVTSQSIESGTEVSKGTVISISCYSLTDDD